MTSLLPDDHPAHILGTPDDDDAYAYLDVHVSGGHRLMDAPSLMRWRADIAVRRYSDTPFKMGVATMGLTVVNPYLGNPVHDLDSQDQDGYELGAALWTYRDGERTEAFEDIAPDDGGHVLLIDTYKMQPDWRGTPVTPLVALRVLDVFAHLGLTTAALTAAPMADDMSRAERSRIAARIAAMWEQVGFSHLDADGKTMAMSFHSGSLHETMRNLAGTDPVLREIIDL